MDDSLEQRIKKVILSTLKCSLCQNLLSVVSKDGGRLRCEVCKDVPGETLSRISAFMKIAQEFSFPCDHEGCEALVPWNEVRKHKEMCNERSVRCPFNNFECAFLKMKELVEHFQNIHKCSVFCDTLTHESDATINKVISVLTFKNHIFFVLTGLDPDFEVLIIKLNNNKNTGMSFTYNVRLSNESNDSTFLIENQQIVSLEKGKYCFACWLENCSIHSDNIGFEYPQNIVIQSVHSPLFKELFGIESASGIKYSIEIVALQKITQELSIPCNYEGCSALVPWNEVQIHEETCIERSFRCPFDDIECAFVKKKELVKHFKKIHDGCRACLNSVIHKLDPTIQRSSLISLVILFKNQIFFVLIGNEPNCEILITMLNNDKDTDMSFSYNARLSNEHNDKIVLFENQQIVSLKEGKYCFACSIKNCSNHNRNERGLKRSQMVIKKINLSHIRTLFGIHQNSDVIICQIDIVDITRTIGETRQ